MNSTSKTWWPLQMGVGIWVKQYPCAYLKNFGSFNASTAKPEKCGFLLNALKNVYRWWVCSLGVSLHSGSNLPPLSPKTIFNGPIKAIILHGSEKEMPLIVDDRSVKVAYWIRNMAMSKPSMESDFTYYLCITWYCACAMQCWSWYSNTHALPWQILLI